MARREARQYKALYFDMRVQALKEFYPKKNHLGAYKEIKNYLLKASEAARIKRRTLNMQDIGASLADDVDL